jgi:23S rRNA pseudouridine955/2504/2580 synthase
MSVDADAARPRLVRVDAEHAGQRLDNFLAAHFRQVPRPRLYRSVRSGEVRVNKGRVRQDYRLREGDLVRLPPLSQAARAGAATPGTGLAERLAAAVLFEDEHLLVLDKPSGLAVHGGSGQSLGLIEAMRALRPELRYLELAHRLDRETSGCLLLAKRRQALISLHSALRESEVDKRYRTLIQGRWRGGGRRIDRSLRRVTGRGGARTVRVDRSGRESSTAFTPLAVSPLASFMEARPHTGRTHQIRVHAAALGMPVAGDSRYGDRAFNAAMREKGLRRLFLHASSLRLIHPASANELRIRAPLPQELREVLAALGLEDDPRAARAGEP